MTQQLAQNLTIQAMVLDDDYKGAPPGRDLTSGPGSGSASLGLVGGSSGIGLSSLGKPKEHKEPGVLGGAIQRMKRFAISAEPTSKKVVNPKDMVITKIDKTDK